MPGFLSNIGVTEIIIIGVILIVLFGSKKIADLGKNAGEATREIKKIKKEVTTTMTEDEAETPTKVSREGVEES